MHNWNAILQKVVYLLTYQPRHSWDIYQASKVIYCICIVPNNNITRLQHGIVFEISAETISSDGRRGHSLTQLSLPGNATRRYQQPAWRTPSLKDPTRRWLHSPLISLGSERDDSQMRSKDPAYATPQWMLDVAKPNPTREGD